ncbi:MAG: DUF1552 domain-containing protein [Myxococcales bacterium]|nr:DUF1552 domain-containing protein [Myxococcales bacterium]
MSLHRRTLLKGLLGGAVVAVGLPPLERFLNAHGTAYAAGGDDGFPRRFGLFFWGNGMLPERWTPKASQADWELSDQLQALAPFKNRLAVITGTKLGVPNDVPHTSGAAGVLSGRPLIVQGSNHSFAGPSLDQLIAAKLGADTRFRSLEFGAKPGDGHSWNGPNSRNPPESSPFALYQRVFVQGFTKPGDTPKIDPTLALRRSVLDAVGQQMQAIRAQVGAADQKRLDQHFEGVRALENRLARLQESPPKLDACKVPATPPADFPDVAGRPQLAEKNKAFAEISAYALACDQVRVFSNWFTAPVNNVLFPGASTGHHELTHNEGNPQPEVHAITLHCIAALAAQLEALAAVQEGAGTLLDHMVVLGTSDVSFGKVHSLEEFPLVLAGSAGGKLKTNVHYRSPASENTSKVLLSICRAVGLDLASFGVDDAQTKDGLGAIEA